MKGKVYNSGDKLPLDSVVVEMIGSDTALVYMTASGAEGKYELLNLPASDYVIQYSRDGFDTVRVSGITISSNKITFMDAGLERSAVESEINRKKRKRN